jgi:hypothetical protein
MPGQVHDAPRKELADFARCGLVPEEEQVDRVVEDEQLPSKSGAATIVCDGKGGYRVALNGWAGAKCGTKDCVRKHEQSHAKDWKGRWPDGCKGKKDGDKIPLGGAGYKDFLKKSECTAHTVDLSCANTLLTAKTKAKDKACITTVKDYIKLTSEQKKSYC